MEGGARKRGVERGSAFYKPEALWTGSTMTLKVEELEALRKLAPPPSLYITKPSLLLCAAQMMVATGQCHSVYGSRTVFGISIFVESTLLTKWDEPFTVEMKLYLFWIFLIFLFPPPRKLQLRRWFGEEMQVLFGWHRGQGHQRRKRDADAGPRLAADEGLFAQHPR